jgi:hypothetical protein
MDSIALAGKSVDNDDEQSQNSNTTETPVKPQDTNTTKKPKNSVNKIYSFFHSFLKILFSRKIL